jgi:hypothetical protein
MRVDVIIRLFILTYLPQQRRASVASCRCPTEGNKMKIELADRPSELRSLPDSD